MKSVSLYRRILSVVLSIVLLSSPVVSATAAGRSGEPTGQQLTLTPVDAGKYSPRKAGQVRGEAAIKAEPYGFADPVRVSIFLDGASTIQTGFSTRGIAVNKQAVAYRNALKKEQTSVTARIEKTIGSTLDVKWNLTLAANLISASVRYGDIAAIEGVEGVRSVQIENRYDPMTAEKGGEAPHMALSSFSIGSNAAWALGYTGAGSKVAIIDTGIDADHQSFDGAALEYALARNAAEQGVEMEDYLAGLDLLTADKIAALADQLNAAIDPDEVYLSAKLPFAFNYVDGDYVIDHIHDTSSEHGTHVAGIAAGNRYVPTAGGFAPALDAVKTQGVAPDAQLFVMKVFGVGGGAYDSDYMGAIEDAIVMGADSVNLSLGSANPGPIFSSGYEDIMNMLTEKGAVVSISAGNSGHWYDTPFPNNGYAAPGHLYLEDVSTDTVGSPGSFNNALTVASSDNNGSTGMPIRAAGTAFFYNESSYSNKPIATLPGEHEYVLIDGFGSAEEWAAADLTGKIAVCSRGNISFYVKAENAVAAGAIATIIYNNTDGSINMDLSSYTREEPAISVTRAVGDLLREAAVPVTDGQTGDVLYYVGTLTVTDEVEVLTGDPDAPISMSSFSSWGVTGALTLKPEITAPGGSIYAANGCHLNEDGLTTSGGPDAYEMMSGTSMASPQVAGMAAVLGQYIREKGLAEKTGLTPRQLINSLLMSTAEPLREDYGDGDSGYYPVLRQGAGLGNVGKAINAKSYILMDEGAAMFPASAKDGKVKAELGDDPLRSGRYAFRFTVNSLDNKDRAYTLSTDLFTQSPLCCEGQLYMDTRTLDLDPEVTFTVGETVYAPVAPFEADVNGDGVTDKADAQAILAYLAGTLDDEAEFDRDEADADRDDAITSYDAHCILKSLHTVAFTAPAGGSFEVTVDIQLSKYDMEILDYYYAKGAYIEGYTYLTPVATEEGEIEDVEQSIPILGFYGNWSDPSMFDTTTVEEMIYGTETRVPYTGNTLDGLQLQYPNVDGNVWVLGNPYVQDDVYHPERLALNDGTLLAQFRYNLIRNAPSMAAAVTDGEGNVLWMSPMFSRGSAYYHVNQAKWMQTNTASFPIDRQVGSLEAAEGDQITVGLYALPEYYAVMAAKFLGKTATSSALTADRMQNMIESGALGEGASMAYTFTVDNTAPQVIGASRDLITGDLTIAARDNRYIASIAIMDTDGILLFSVDVPQQAGPGEEVFSRLQLGEEKLPSALVIFVADYAGNETAYEVNTGGDQTDSSGGSFGYPLDSARDSGNRRITVDPQSVYCVGGEDLGDRPAALRGDERSRGEGAGLNAVNPIAAAASGDVTVTVTEEAAVTNGFVTLLFDPDLLTFNGAASDLPCFAAAEDGDMEGLIFFAYAAAEEIPAGTPLATLGFSYTGDYVETELQFITLERNDGFSLMEDWTIRIVKEDAHAYGAPVWTWAEENTATASFTCVREDDTRTLTASVTSQTTPAACTAAGQTVYTATVEFQGKTYTDQKTVVIPAAGHSYGEPVWQWAPDGSIAVAIFTCVKEDDVQRVAAASITSRTDGPTCTQDGQTLYTASLAFNGLDYTDTYTAVIPAEGHVYGEPVWTWAEDNTATVAFTCEEGDDTRTLTAAVTSRTTPATNLETGKTVYTATVEFGGRIHTSGKTVEIPVIPLEKEALEKLVEEAPAPETLAIYTEESAQKYKDALAAAQKALTEGKTQKELDAAAAALAAAEEALEPVPVLLGDVDGDGKITSTDARLVLQLSVDKIQESDLNAPAAADVDGDGKITSTDARLILQLSVNKINGFPKAATPSDPAPVEPDENETPLQP